MIKSFDNTRRAEETEKLRQTIVSATSSLAQLEAIFQAQKLGLMPLADAYALFLAQGDVRLILT